jgi:hypothetical protein
MIPEEDYRNLTDHLPVVLTLRTTVSAPPTAPLTSGTLRIVAVLPNPHGDDAQLEEVHTANGGATATPLTGWRITNAARQQDWTLTAQDGTVAPGQTVIVVRRGRPMSLRNTGDSVVLLNPTGETADTKSYGNAPEREAVPVRISGPRRSTQRDAARLVRSHGGGGCLISSPTPSRLSPLRQREEGAMAESCLALTADEHAALLRVRARVPRLVASMEAYVTRLIETLMPRCQPARTTPGQVDDLLASLADRIVAQCAEPEASDELTGTLARLVTRDVLGRMRGDVTRRLMGAAQG